MGKLISLIVLFGIPFVLLASMALTMEYSKIGAAETVNLSEVMTEAYEDHNGFAGLPLLQPVTQAEITAPPRLSRD